MIQKYNQDVIELKLGSLMQLIEDASGYLQQIDAIKKINDAIDKTRRLVIKLKNIDPIMDLNQYDHFVQVVKLLEDMLGIQKIMIGLAINNIDPKPAGYASRAYENIGRIKDNTPEPDDVNILWNIVKVISKPFSYIMDIFESISPDKWRIASNWQKVKLGMGLGLTLLGVAFIVTAIVLTVANPVGAGLAVVGGIGLTVSVAGFGFGVAAFLCCAFGGVFLKITSNTLSKKLDKKRELEKLNNECDKFKQQLDKKIEFVKGQINKQRETLKHNSPSPLILSQNSQAPTAKNLSAVQAAVSNLKRKLNNRPASPGKQKTE